MVRLLSCDKCGIEQWCATEGTPCMMTLGCTGRMRRKGDKKVEQLELPHICDEGVCWHQQELFSQSA